MPKNIVKNGEESDAEPSDTSLEFRATTCLMDRRTSICYLAVLLVLAAHARGDGCSGYCPLLEGKLVNSASRLTTDEERFFEGCKSRRIEKLVFKRANMSDTPHLLSKREESMDLDQIAALETPSFKRCLEALDAANSAPAVSQTLSRSASAREPGLRKMMEEVAPKPAAAMSASAITQGEKAATPPKAANTGKR